MNRPQTVEAEEICSPMASERIHWSTAIPKRIRVAGYDIAVKAWPHSDAQEQQRFAEWSAIQCCIRIDETLNQVRAVDCLLHELNHAIYWAYGFNDGDKEERLCGMFSAAYTQVFRDSPELLRWIAEMLSPGEGKFK